MRLLEVEAEYVQVKCSRLSVLELELPDETPFSTVQSLTFARVLFEARTEVPSRERKRFELRFVIV